MAKACIDCRYCADDHVIPRCTNTLTIPLVAMILGFDAANKNYPVDATHIRWNERLCGPDGKWFEPRGQSRVL